MPKRSKAPTGLGSYARKKDKHGNFVWKRRVNGESYVVKRQDYTDFRKEVERRQEEIKALGNGAAPRDQTVSQFFPKWNDTFNKPPKKARGTYRSYKGNITNHIVKRLGKYKVARLTTIRIQECINEMEDQGVGTRTIQLFYVVLHKGLQSAIDQGIIARNPAVGCEVPKSITTDMRVLSPAEMRALIVDCYRRPPNRSRPVRNRLLFRFKLGCGMRIGEVLGLLRINCDLENGIVKINTQLEWDEKKKDAKGRPLDEPAEWRLIEPKGKKKRTIVLEPEVLKILRQQVAFVERDKAMIDDYEDNGLVFPTVRGTPQYPRNVQRQLDISCARAKVKVGNRTHVGMAHVHLHDLRRTCLTNFANRGMPMHQLQAYAGHSSITTTAKYYLGVSLEAQRAGLQNLKPLEETVSTFAEVIHMTARR